MEVGAWCSYRSYSVFWIWSLLEWVALLLGSEDERKATQAGTGRAESTLPNPETRWNWIAINSHEQNVMPRKRWAGFFFSFFPPLARPHEACACRAGRGCGWCAKDMGRMKSRTEVILHVNCSKREKDKGMCHVCVRRPVVFYWQIVPTWFTWWIWCSQSPGQEAGGVEPRDARGATKRSALEVRIDSIESKTMTDL